MVKDSNTVRMTKSEREEDIEMMGRQTSGSKRPLHGIQYDCAVCIMCVFVCPLLSVYDAFAHVFNQVAVKIPCLKKRSSFSLFTHVCISARAFIQTYVCVFGQIIFTVPYCTCLSYVQGPLTLCTLSGTFRQLTLMRAFCPISRSEPSRLGTALINSYILMSSVQTSEIVGSFPVV